MSIMKILSKLNQLFDYGLLKMSKFESKLIFIIKL